MTSYNYVYKVLSLTFLFWFVLRRCYCCSVKAINIVCSECGFLALVIQHAIILYCHLWAVWLYHIFAYFLINTTILGGGRTFIDNKMGVFIF